MLLSRDRELEAIGALLQRARDGSSGVLALVGEAGIGKSALVDWAAAQAEGMHVLRVRGVQSEAHIPFAGLFELLRPALDGVERLPAPQAAALESALALAPPRSHDRLAVGAATLSLLASHADSAPLAVIVDDAHWLDGSTSDALRFALRRLVADPIAVLLAVREGERSLLDGADFPTHRVAGLDPGAAAELVRREAPRTSAEAAARLHRDTGGNPLALLELARAQPPDAPPEARVPAMTSVAARFLDAAAALPESARAALVLAAADDSGELQLLARAAAPLGLDVDSFLPAEAHRLVAMESGRLEFRHPLIRSAIYADAPPEQRRAAHRALAGVLPDSEADRRAWHLALAAVGPDGRAADALEQAGVRARERSAYAAASHCFERAALLAPDEDVRARLTFAAADSAWFGGLGERAATLVEDARERAAGETLAIAIEHLRGHIALRRGPVRGAREILLAAADRAAATDPATAVVMLAEAAEGAFFQGDAAAMRSSGERAEALAGSADTRAAFFARMTAGMARILSGEGAQGAALIREAVVLIEDLSETAHDARLLAWGAMGPIWLREAGVGEGLVERALAAARAHPAAGTLPHILIHIGIAEAAGDRLIPARATFGEAIGLARETGQRTILAGALARLAWAEARAGHEEAAREHGDEALALARELGAHLFEIWALAALGEHELGRGDAAAALERLAELQAALERNGISDVDLSPGPERVELLLRTGRPDDAERVAAAFIAAAEAKGQPWACARAARCAGLLAPDGDFDHRFEEALDLHARTPDAFEAARTQLAYGARLRRAGQRVRARERLRDALETFEDLGAAPWAEFARIELKATGETARRRDPSSLDDLTPQELTVALLLAEGRTTREAAATLFLSPKTIEYHLRNAYRKLGVRSRDRLAEVLGGQSGPRYSSAAIAPAARAAPPGATGS